MKKIAFLNLIAAAMLFAFSCRKDQYLAPDISGVGTDTIVLNIGDKKVLAPSITNLSGNSYTWLVNGKEVASGQMNYTFEATDAGDFKVTFKVNNKGGASEQSFAIQVEKPIEISIANLSSVPMCNVIEVAPRVTGPARADYTYEWLIGDSVIGRSLNLSFISPAAGTYALTLRATSGKQTATATGTITVTAAQYISNAYTVLEYAPAPGKLHNWSVLGDKILWDLGYEHPLPYNDFLAKATDIRKTDASASLYIGSWGGYATFKFDHTVVNVPGKTDLELSAFYSNREIPAVYVAYDRNKNGKPDEDEWYEIKNTDYGLEDTADYEITFTYDKTDAETDAKRVYTYFNWKDNKDEPAEGKVTNVRLINSSKTLEGNMSTMGFFPGYYMNISTKKTVLLDGWKSSFSRKGKRITRDVSGANPFSQKLNIDIDMAVNAKGETVLLPGIDFVKVRKLIYPYQQDFINNQGKLTDFNMEEGRMLQVGTIIDRNLKK